MNIIRQVFLREAREHVMKVVATYHQLEHGSYNRTFIHEADRLCEALNIVLRNGTGIGWQYATMTLDGLPHSTRVEFYRNGIMRHTWIYEGYELKVTEELVENIIHSKVLL